MRKEFTVKKLLILVALIAVAAFAFSKFTGGNEEEHEFGA